MTSIILLRYHKDFELVKSRVALYRSINPNMEIHGLYGGSQDELKDAEQIIGDDLKTNYYVPSEDNRWKWAHADITYQKWFKAVGYQLNFDRVYVIEYDLLLLKSLDKLFSHIGKDELGFTGLIPLETIEAYWYWTANEEHRKRYEVFKKSINTMFPGATYKEYAMLGPGVCLSRAFLEKLKDVKMIDGDFTDELKLHIWAQVLGFPVKNNKLVKQWISPKEYKFFNSSGVEIKLDTIVKEMRKPWGRRAFHPYFQPYSIR